MARKQGSTAHNDVYAAEAGNACRECLFDVLSNTVVDTEIELGTFPYGTTLDAVTVLHDGLGAGTSIELGVEAPWDAAVTNLTLFGSFDTATAASERKEIKPFYTGKNQVKLIAKVKGAAATGELFVKVDYRYKGAVSYE